MGTQSEQARQPEKVRRIAEADVKVSIPMIGSTLFWCTRNRPRHFALGFGNVTKSPSRRTFDFFPLEDRVLLSGEGIDASGLDIETSDLSDSLMAELTADGHVIEPPGTPLNPSLATSPHADRNGDADQDSSDASSDLGDVVDAPTFDPALPIEVVFVDAGVEDADTLLADLRGDRDGNVQWWIVRLSADSDGVQQITRSLASLSGVDAIHILSHGDGDGIALGNVKLTLDSAPSYGGDIASWGHSLDSDADILIYGCDLASTQDGQDLVDLIAIVTDADVAASDDVTGHSDLGGDWILEYTVGDVQTDVAFGFMAQASWRGTLDTSSDLVAHYEFDSDALSLANDSSGNSNTGTYDNGESLTPGVVGTQAADFSGDAAGDNNFISVSDDASIDFGTSDFTISVWIKIDAANGGEQTVLSHQGTNGYRIYVDASGLLRFNQTSGGSNTTSNFGLITDSQWHQATVTRSGGAIATYLDGNLVGSNSGLPLDLSTNVALTIGASSATTNDFEGQIDDLRLYARQFTPTEAGDLYAETATVDITTGLILHNRFDADASDSSGNNHNGTLTNGATIDSTGGTNQIGGGKLSLDGTNDYVDFSPHVATNFDGLTEGTISAWIYHDVARRDVIFELSDSGDPNSRLALFSDADGSLDVFIREGTTVLLDGGTSAGLIAQEHLDARRARRSTAAETGCTSTASNNR